MITKQTRSPAARQGRATEADLDQLRRQMQELLEVVGDLAKLIIAMTERLDHVQALAEQAEKKGAVRNSSLRLGSQANKRRLDN